MNPGVELCIFSSYDQRRVRQSYWSSMPADNFCLEMCVYNVELETGRLTTPLHHNDHTIVVGFAPGLGSLLAVGTIGGRHPCAYDVC